MKRENLDDIKKLFGEETELPAELSKENVTKKLALISVKKKSKIKTFSKYAAAAAAVVIIAIGAVSVGGLERKVNFEAVEQKNDEQSICYAPIDIGIKPNKISRFSDDKDLENYFTNIAKENNGSVYYDFIHFLSGAKTENSEAVVQEIADENKNEAGIYINSDGYREPGSSAAHGETNTQVKGVDEADIIKNDGRYLYIISDDSLLTIVDTQTMDAVFSKKVESNEKDKVLTANEIYLKDNTLVVAATEYEENKEEKKENYREFSDVVYPYYISNCKTVNIIFDVKDKGNPKELRRFTQDGLINSSRMIGSVLYTVTNYSVNIDDKSKIKDKCYPTVNGKKSDANEIYVIDKSKKETSYIILSAFNTANTDSEVNSVSVLGCGDKLYCSNNNMYVIENSFNLQTGKDVVNIYSFALDGDKVYYKACGVVPGDVEGQYFIDEYNSYLRIATNDYNYHEDKDISSLYALDMDLNVVGKLENFSDDEQIKSIRFMGDTAYVVTFKNTDPLFAIDMSDLSKMKILGTVKLPGFSEYLHSVGDGLLVGIGYDGDEEDADFSTVKITLFDVSDKMNPKVLDTHVIKNAVSDVNYEPKAFLFYAEENIIGIPISYYDNYGAAGENYQFKLLKIENGKFTDKYNFAHPSTGAYNTLFFRGSYIADKLYTITNLSVAQFDIQSGELIKTLTYANPDVNQPQVYNGVTEAVSGADDKVIVTATTSAAAVSEADTAAKGEIIQ